MWLPTLCLRSRDAHPTEGMGLLGGCSASPACKVPGDGSAFTGEPCGSAVPLGFAQGRSCAAEGVISWAVRNTGLFTKRQPAQGLRAEGCKTEAGLVMNGFT